MCHPFHRNMELCMGSAKMFSWCQGFNPSCLEYAHGLIHVEMIYNYSIF